MGFIRVFLSAPLAAFARSAADIVDDAACESDAARADNGHFHVCKAPRSRVFSRAGDSGTDAIAAQGRMATGGMMVRISVSVARNINADARRREPAAPYLLAVEGRSSVE